MDESIQLTEEQIKELIRCYEDPIYFINNYVWIELKETQEIVPFDLYNYQEVILDWLVNGKNGVILKSRRVGASTVVAAYTAWLLNFRRGVNVLFVSRTERDAKKLLSKVKFNLFNLAKHTHNDIRLCEKADWMLNPIAYNTLTTLGIAWTNNYGEVESYSTVESLTTSGESGRGDSASFVFMDEFAFIKDQEETFRAASLTALRGGNWFVASTPNSSGNLFHSLCQRADRHENENYEYLRVHWSEANITQEQINAVTEGMNSADAMQEMEMEFISTGDPVFDPLHLSACYKPPHEYPEIANALVKYREEVFRGINDPNKKSGVSDLYYYTGVDTAIGKLNKKDSKRDYHSFTALTKTGIQAFAFHTKKESLSDWAGTMQETESLGVVQKIGRVSQLHKQWPGYMQIEDNGPGHMTVNNHQIPNDGISYMEAKTSTAKSKGGLTGYINQLIMAIESHSIIITDEFTYQCLSVFQRGTTPGVFAAPNGDYFDDPVISLALAYDGLLKEGKLDFPWGVTSDQVGERYRLTVADIDELNAKNGPVGPALSLKRNGNERASSSFDEGREIIIDTNAGIDLNRLREPEFIGRRYD